MLSKALKQKGRSNQTKAILKIIANEKVKLTTRELDLVSNISEKLSIDESDVISNKQFKWLQKIALKAVKK